MRPAAFLLPAALLLPGQGARAQEPATAAAAPAAPVVSANELVVPALTPVTLEIGAPLGSKTSTTGERFPIVLKEPILVDGRVAIPAGAAGEGEVIHAKKAGGSGAAGELVLAARFVRVGDRQLRLRSMRIALAGKDAIHAVDTANAVAVLSPIPVGLLGFAVTGRNIELPDGAIALAKTAQAFTVQPAPAGAPAAPPGD